MNVSTFYTSSRREKSTFPRFQPANIQQIINVEKFFCFLLIKKRDFSRVVRFKVVGF